MMATYRVTGKYAGSGRMTRYPELATAALSKSPFEEIIFAAGWVASNLLERVSGERTDRLAGLFAQLPSANLCKVESRTTVGG